MGMTNKTGLDPKVKPGILLDKLKKQLKELTDPTERLEWGLIIALLEKYISETY